MPARSTRPATRKTGPRVSRLPAPAAQSRRRAVPRRASRRAAGCTAAGCSRRRRRRASPRSSAATRRLAARDAASRHARRLRRLPPRRRRDRRRVQHQRNRPRRSSRARTSATTHSRRTPAQGYMSEGLELVLRVAFRQLKLHRVEANVQPSNSALARARAARGIRPRGIFAALREDRRTLARSRAAGAAGRGLARAGATRARDVTARAHRSPSRALALVARCATPPTPAMRRRSCARLALAVVPDPRGMLSRSSAGDRIEFAFESTEPVDFNIHYHEGNAVVMPIVARQVARGRRRFTRPRSRRTIA